jgi:RNase P/RNase MRP subunit p29
VLCGSKAHPEFEFVGLKSRVVEFWDIRLLGLRGRGFGLIVYLKFI